MPTPSEITRLLKQWSQGDSGALDRLMPLVYERLSEMAHAHLRRERSGHILNTKGLVHETYLKLVDINQVEWRDRAHFLSMASRLMRRILVDYSRQRNAQKRSGGLQRVDFQEELLMSESNTDVVLELDDALSRLEELSPRQCQAVEQHYFGGLTADESAAVLGVSRATVERDLRAARAWLAREWERPSMP